MRFTTHKESVYFTTRYPWTCGDGCCSETEYGDHTFSANTMFEVWPYHDRIEFDNSDHEGEWIPESSFREAIANEVISPVDEWAIEWATND